MPNQTSTTGAVIYQGPSALDGAPIVAIVTGLTGRSKNPKTGPLAQLWILRADMSPLDAIKTGQDVSICGDCRHRGDGTGRQRGCYVSVKNAPLAVWRAYHAGRYRRLAARTIARRLAARGLGIRVGAYGDGAALPRGIVRDVVEGIQHTGYTHAWRTLCPQDWPWLMASVDTPDEQQTARRAGWRTFRVRRADESLRSREIVCPASEEGGKRTTCAACVLCDGSAPGDARASIAIIAHGTGTASYVSTRALLAARA